MGVMFDIAALAKSLSWLEWLILEDDSRQILRCFQEMLTPRAEAGYVPQGTF